MNWRCAICGRVTLQPAVMLGAKPIGPKCARLAGLLTLTKRRGARVAPGRRMVPKRDGRTRDLFEGAPA